MEDRQPAAAASGVRGPLHGEPPVDETFKCLCERCKVSAQANGALFLCSWNRKALGKLACGLFSFFFRASVLVRTTAVEHVSFVLSLTSLMSLTSPYQVLSAKTIRAMAPIGGAVPRLPPHVPAGQAAAQSRSSRGFAAERGGPTTRARPDRGSSRGRPVLLRRC